MDEYASYFVKKMETKSLSIPVPLPTIVPTDIFMSKSSLLSSSFREKVTSLLLNAGFSFSCSYRFFVSSEIFSYPLLNFKSSLSIVLFTSASKCDKDLILNLLFQSFTLFFFKHHRKCFTGALSGFPHFPFLSQPTTSSPPTLS